MAKELMGGLPDPSKINPYGAPTADVEEYQRSLEDSVRALEQRYAQPNWFNVAAGFFKPQLGGFGASLGSAAQAMGETVEKQRESQLPIAQMRAQLAASKIGMGQNKTAAQMVSEWQASGKPLTPEFVGQVAALAPDSAVAKSLQAQLGTMQKNRELASSEQGNAMQRVQLARQMGTEPNPNDLALLAAASPTAPAPNATTTAPAPNAMPAPDTMAAPSAATPKWTGTALSAPMLRDLETKAAAGDPTSKEILASYKEAHANDPLPATVTLPPTRDIPDPKRQEIVTESTKQHANDLEKVSNERYTGLTNFTAPEFSNPVKTAATTVLSMMKENPAAADRVLNLVRKAGPLAAALDAGAQAQVSSSIGSVGGSVALPVRAYLSANLAPEDQVYADKLSNALMTLKAAGMKLSQVSPTALVNHPAALGSIQSLNFDMTQTPAALYNTAKHFQITQDFLTDYANGLKEELKRVQPSSLTRFTDAFNSPRLEETAKRYQTAHDALDAMYLKKLPKGKQ